jgi:hypothetical protein
MDAKLLTQLLLPLLLPLLLLPLLLLPGCREPPVHAGHEQLWCARRPHHSGRFR